MKYVLAFVLISILPALAVAQAKDSLIVKDKAGNIVTGPVAKDTTVINKHKHTPRGATLRSAIIPGWGQIYNKKYWKVPIVYTAIGIPVYLFIDNKRWYNRTRYALAVVANQSYNNPDSLGKVDARLRPLVDLRAQNSLLNYRNQFRKNMDYSILFGLLFWGLNVVDATVDGHLKDFDVNDNLSFTIKPALLANNTPGISFVFTVGKTHPKPISSLSQF